MIQSKNIKIIKTNRGGKITYHGPGQLICYFVIDLNKRKKDWVAPKVNVKNAFLRKYAKLVSSASIGAVTSGD